MSPFLFCTLKPVTLTPTELRWDLLNVGVGVLLLVIGLTVSTLFFFRLKWKDRSLIYFGVFTILYAVRLLGDRMLIDSVFDVSKEFWRYFSFFISSFIVLPFGLYLYEIVEPEVKRILPWVIGVQATFAVGEIVGAIYGVSLDMLNATNSIVTIGTVIPSLIWILIARRKRPANHDIKVFFGGLIFWFL